MIAMLRGRGAFLRMFSSAVISQALISAANFIVGLVLIRHQSDTQYGYYVLVITTMMLLAGVQSAYIGPAMIVRLTRLDLAGRRDLIGGVQREQRRLIPVVGVVAAAVTGVLWSAGVLDGPLVALIGAAILAVMAALAREFFRMVLSAYRRPLDILRADAVYVTLLVGGVHVAIFSPLPAATAVLTMSFAALAGGVLLRRALTAHEGWNIHGAPGILREFLPVGSWSVFGAAVHWAFSQGYTYIVAGTLDVKAVAAIAATRLLLMPVNLLSQGIAQMMLPTASKWLHDHDVAQVFRRLTMFCVGVAGLALAYCAVMWLMRDWIFENVMKKQIEHRDALLFLWCMIFLLMAMRDQMAHLLVARSRMRLLSTMTFFSAVASLAICYAAMLRFGVVGALLGVLAGEFLNLAGIAIMSLVETRRPNPVPA